MLVWFLPLFLVFLVIGLPVFFGLLAAPGLLLWLNGQERDIALLYRNVYNGMDSFPLMAIPFFMLAGELMNRGGITLRLVEFSQAMMGHLKGGLAHVNINSVTGYTSAVGDVPKISNDAISLFSDKAKYNEFAQNALSSAKEYDIFKILPLYEAVYREALEAIK